MKGVSIWMPLVIGDHRVDCSAFDTMDHGAYILLLMAWWDADGALPDDDKILAKIAMVTPKQWAVMKRTVMRPFTLSSGTYVHDRLTGELEKAKRNQTQKRVAGIASGASRRANGRSTDVDHTLNARSNGCSTADEPRAGEGEGGGPSRVRSLGSTSGNLSLKKGDW